MKLICEVVEDVQYITEENKDSGKKDLYIVGPYLQWDNPNKNRRIYPREILEHEVNNFSENKIKHNRAYGELNHPDTPKVNLDRVAVLIKELKSDGNSFFMGKAKVVDTPMGNITRNLINEGAKLGVSSRALGTLTAKDGYNHIGKDFALKAIDVVADPSMGNAFVNGIMEDVDWLWDGKEYIAEKARKAIEESVAHREFNEAKAFEIFERFLDGMILR